MNELQYLLGRVAEEASEITKIALKAQAFGIEFPNPLTGEVNRDQLEAELNDLDGTVALLRECLKKTKNLDLNLHDPQAIAAKIAKIRYYARYAIQEGTLSPSCAEETVLQNSI